MQRPSSSRIGAAGLHVEFDDRDREAVGEKRRDAADRAGLPLGVVEREGAFGCRVEFEDGGDREAFLEGLPNVRPQPVAAADPQPMLALSGARRRGQKIAAELADILEQRAIEADDVVPELPGGKPFANRHRPAADQHARRRYDAADAVIHRQAVVHAVVGAGIQHAGEPVAPHHDAVVADIGRLGEAGGSRRVDAERPVGVPHGSRFAGRERVAPVAPDVEPGAVRDGLVPDDPDPRRRCEVRPRAIEGSGELRCDDDMARRGDGHAVRQRGVGQVGVEECHHAADTGDAEPHRQIVGRVRHQEADRLALGHPLFQRPAGPAAAARGEVGKGQPLAIGDKGGSRREAIAQPVDHHRQRAERLGIDPGRQLEGAQPPARRRILETVIHHGRRHGSGCAGRRSHGRPHHRFARGGSRCS